MASRIWKTALFLLTYIALFLGVEFLGQCSSTESVNTQQASQLVAEMQGKNGANMPKSKGNPKLSSRLNQMLEAYRIGGMAEAKTFAINHNMVLQDNRIQVTIVTGEKATGDVRKAVEAIGGDYQLHYRNLVQVILPISVLETMAKRPDVEIIREPRRAVKP
jgi:hypothetical protein